MLGSISPVGESSRGQRWWLTASAYTVASAVAGALLGLALGGIGAVILGGVPAAVRLVALGVALLAATLTDAGVIGTALPSWRRQVDERWLTTYRGWVYGAGFGAQLGVGLATIVTSASTYAALAAALLAGSWRAGLLIGGVFGAVRTLPLVAMAPIRAADRLHTVTRRVEDAEPSAHRLTVTAQAVLTAVTVLAAVGS